MKFKPFRSLVLAFLIASIGGCGGGGSSNSGPAQAPSGLSQPVSFSVSAAQKAALDRLNFYRSIVNVPATILNSALTQSSTAHSNYTNATDETGHYETQTNNPYYTGYSPGDRISAAGYKGLMYGEVYARTADTDVTNHVDLLIMAIYHRFPMLSPSLTEAGAGVASKSNATDLTINMGAPTLPPPSQTVVVYPTAGQTGIPVNFNPASESPNPAVGYSLVGYPISVQADIGAALVVNTFTVTPVGGAGTPLSSKILSSASDAHTPNWAVGLVPLVPLANSTTYQVAFTGTLNGTPISRNWQFSTAPYVAPTLTFAPSQVAAGQTTTATIQNLDSQKYPSYAVCYSSGSYIERLTFNSYQSFDIKTLAGSCGGASCPLTVVIATDSSCATHITQGTLNITP